LLHCYDPGCTTRRNAEAALTSFFAEAEHYGNCERVLLESDALSGILNYCAANDPDLLVMPVSDRVGIPRFGHKSMRGRILRECRTPMWTVGRTIEQQSFSGPVRNIACWVNYESANLNHLREACALAMRMNAVLQLVHVVPHIDEGTLGKVLDGYRPLHPNVALDRLSELGMFLPSKTEVHVAVGTAARELPKMLKRCAADLLFVGEGQALVDGWRGYGLNSLVDRCPCPVMCFDGASANRQTSSRDVWWPSAQPVEERTLAAAAGHMLAR
jgi:nucleotide-binding universal stress UspA family protein